MPSVWVTPFTVNVPEPPFLSIVIVYDVLSWQLTVSDAVPAVPVATKLDVVSVPPF